MGISIFAIKFLLRNHITINHYDEVLVRCLQKLVAPEINFNFNYHKTFYDNGFSHPL